MWAPNLEYGEYVWRPLKKMDVLEERGTQHIYDTCPFDGAPAGVEDTEGKNKYCPFYRPM